MGINDIGLTKQIINALKTRLTINGNGILIIQNFLKRFLSCNFNEFGDNIVKFISFEIYIFQ